MARCSVLLLCAVLGAGVAPCFGERCDSVKTIPKADFLIRKFGFPVENHRVTTEDGYILGLFRIPGPHIDSAEKIPHRPKPAILLMHGLVQNAATFMLRREESLPFLLANKGYDVWLGSARGTVASSEHTHLSNKSLRYWDFSWHENGVYDVPAIVSYIKRTTGQQRIQYVGHSMGTTMLFVMCSMLPERCRQDIRGAYLLAPTTYLGHSKGVTALMADIEELFGVHGVISFAEKFLVHGEFKLSSTLFREVVVPACSSSLLWRSCLKAIQTVVGPADKGSVGQQEVSDLLCYSTDNVSAKQLMHYAQGIVRDKVFRQFSYNPWKNIKKYGSLRPPSYPLSNVSIPLSLYYGDGDYFVQPKDLKDALTQLPNIRRLYKVPAENFRHTDFLYRTNVKKVLYDPMVQDALQDLQNLI